MKFSTNFNQVVKTIMLLAVLGQKRQIGKNLLRDLHNKEFSMDRQRSVFDSKFGSIKEQQIRLTGKSIAIISQNIYKCDSNIVTEINGKSQYDRNAKDDDGGNSPTSIKSGHDSNWSSQNGKSVRKFKVNQASNFNLRI